MYDIILPYVDRAYDTDHTAISLDFPVPFPDAHLHRLASEFETSDRARPPGSVTIQHRPTRSRVAV
ncbi:hypothetical protein WL88_11425 [Burkholderia diffusa]|uniref:Uncharacterized protein n=1 Tax=Burkholderia diffusa TaxID=488732 RepID=A0AAW3PJE0_9BURK|nr:hypothetical protein [Burkholderia diffusa]KVH51136.1 hypothetical protein WJ39_08205 [Burkholderia diffusa]KWF28663.1 hypothetical protein WL85_26605 [Burkholderia diffusa]KWF39948.1 hypothetical protein WL87_30190 [Burkholderia diffusa]KWF41849.1 hypothetical protein WL86_13410 [Burkholderia diffusa]KWF56492.1 hypothetical protein WL88_11425 [Burkholderia diffusa]